MDQAALQQEMNNLDAQGLQLKEATKLVKDQMEIANNIAKQSASELEQVLQEEKEAVETAEEKAKTDVQKAEASVKRATEKLKTVKNSGPAQVLAVKMEWFEKRNAASIKKFKDEEEAGLATKNFNEVDRTFLNTQHRYQELRDQLSIAKGTADMDL
ncbi:hypothetical protein PRIC2_011106 [Phytophthora ramorum]